MKRSMFHASVALLGLLLFAVSPARSQGNFGVGLVIGEPTGIAWTYKMTPTNSLSGGIGTTRFDRYRFHADYLWTTHPFTQQRLGLHYGLGAVLGVGPRSYVVVDGQREYLYSDGDPGFGIRGVAGLNYTIPDTPLDVFLEAGPLVVLAPATSTGVDVGFGMRVYP
jgi:hypothetical protein